jgi:hypothetical protein
LGRGRDEKVGRGGFGWKRVMKREGGWSPMDEGHGAFETYGLEGKRSACAWFPRAKECGRNQPPSSLSVSIDIAVENSRYEKKLRHAA